MRKCLRKALAVLLGIASVVWIGGCTAVDDTKPSGTQDTNMTQPTGTEPTQAPEPATPLITDYQEKYRSQYHFSPASGWMGDLDGCVYYNGEYHMFWWGKATSRDLVHFDQVTVGNCFALVGDPGLGDYYTGGAVVDRNNTAGFGANKLIAIYTIPKSPQIQGISVSTDETFDSLLYYPGNPVLEKEGTQDFRDPAVFWDEKAEHWVMAIALPVEKKVSFYSSPDMKQWTWMSDFGPLGAREGLWECPDLIRLTTEDGTEKWVLIVSVGPNKEQYFVGEFDGTSFVPDPATLDHLTKGTGLDGQIFADFENGIPEGWTAEGKAFENAVSTGEDNAHLGGGYIRTDANGIGAVGSLLSPEFVIEKSAINFLLGSNKEALELSVELLVNGETVRTSYGDGTGYLKWNGWDVSDLTGQTAQIRIRDDSISGYVMMDQILFSDALHNEKLEHALWVDFGTDFYASRSFRDYDGTLENTAWMGWMGNWDYANATPAIAVAGFYDQRGTWSIARDLHLTTVDGVPRLTQSPVAGLTSLRGDAVTVSRTLTEGTGVFTEFQPSRNTYEFEAVFTPGARNSEFGFNLLVGDGRSLKLGYDAATSTLYLDRTNCADVSIKDFKRYMSAAVPLKDGQLKLRVFIDKQSVEVFANDGERVLTALTFPAEEQVGVEIFSDASATQMEFTGWMLDSIWPGHIQQMPETVNDSDDAVVYEGDWQRFDGDDAYANGDCHVTGTGSVSLTFRGTSVDWYGLVNSDLGMVDVYLDGEPVLEGLDLYSPVRRRQKLFSKTELSAGEHTITVQASGRKNPESTGTGVVHDTFVYLPVEKTP